MINIRQISNVTKDGSEYTLVDVRVVAEDRENGKQATALKEVGTTFTSVSALFVAIQAHTVDVIQSGLI